VSIGVAVARNFIGSMPDGSDVATTGRRAAVRHQRRRRGELRGHRAGRPGHRFLRLRRLGRRGVGLAVGVGVSGAGVFAENIIGVDVLARSTARALEHRAASVTLKADGHLEH